MELHSPADKQPTRYHATLALHGIDTFSGELYRQGPEFQGEFFCDDTTSYALRGVMTPARGYHLQGLIGFGILLPDARRGEDFIAPSGLFFNELISVENDHTYGKVAMRNLTSSHNRGFLASMIGQLSTYAKYLKEPAGSPARARQQRNLELAIAETLRHTPGQGQLSLYTTP